MLYPVQRNIFDNFILYSVCLWTTWAALHSVFKFISLKVIIRIVKIPRTISSSRCAYEKCMICAYVSCSLEILKNTNEPSSHRHWCIWTILYVILHALTFLQSSKQYFSCADNTHAHRNLFPTGQTGQAPGPQN